MRTFKLLRPDLSRFDPDKAGDADVGVFGLPFGPAECSVHLFGYPWEPTTSYSQGTAQGPRAIFEASAQLDLVDADLRTQGLGCPYKHGIYWHPEDQTVRELNRKACAIARSDSAQAIQEVNQLSSQFTEIVQDQVRSALEAGHLVGVVGGDHSVPLGAIGAHASRGPFGILHVDAHADLRVAYEGFTQSHASIMHNVLEHYPAVSKLVQVGIRDLSEAELLRIDQDPKIHTLFGPQIDKALSQGQSWQSLCDELVAALPARVYISVDIDGLDPTYCPHTGTPVPGGLSFAQLGRLLMSLVEQGKEVIGFDLCEVAPPLDAQGQPLAQSSADEWDANVGARVLYRLCGVLLHAQGARDAERAERAERAEKAGKAELTLRRES